MRISQHVTCCAAGFAEAMKLELLRPATLIMQQAPGLLQSAFAPPIFSD